MNTIQEMSAQLGSINPTSLVGSVLRTEGTTVAVAGFPAPVGGLVEISRQSGSPVQGEVIGLRDDLTLVYPYDSIQGVHRGSTARLLRTSHFVRVGNELLGRVIDAHGQCIEIGGAHV